MQRTTFEARRRGWSAVQAAVVTMGVLLATSSPRVFAQVDPLGGATLGVFLNSSMDKADQIVFDARNAGNAVAMESGRQAVLAIQNAKNAYAESLNKTASQLNQATLNAVGQIKSLTDDLFNKVAMTIDTATARAQQIVNTLPFAKTEPQVTSVSPRYVVRGVAGNVQVVFQGNFPSAAQQDYAPSLSLGGKVFTGSNTTLQLTFELPPELLFAAPAGPGAAVQFSPVSLIIPWPSPWLFGLFDSRKEDHYNVAIGSLPNAPGQLTIVHTVTGTKPETKNFCATGFHQCSTAPCGNNDDKDHHHSVPAETGWHVVRGTSSAPVTAVQGDVRVPSFVSDAGDAVEYVASTIHHGPFGSSGSVDFNICFAEEREVPTSRQDSESLVLKWGDSKTYDFAPGSYQVTLKDFNGGSVDFTGPDNRNPFVWISEPGGKLKVEAASAAALRWP